MYEPLPYLVPRLAVGLALLLYAAWTDYKTHQVPNATWGIGAATVVLLWVPALNSPQAGTEAATALIATALAVTAWTLGLYGAADAKGLSILAWLLPDWRLLIILLFLVMLYSLFGLIFRKTKEGIPLYPAVAVAWFTVSFTAIAATWS